MPKIGYHTIYFWSEKEKNLRNTERHKVFQKQLYLMYKDNTNNSRMSKEEWDEKLAAFKEKNFDLLFSEKSDSVRTAEYNRGDASVKSSGPLQIKAPSDSKLNNQKYEEG